METFDENTNELVKEIPEGLSLGDYQLRRKATEVEIAEYYFAKYGENAASVLKARDLNNNNNNNVSTPATYWKARDYSVQHGWVCFPVGLNNGKDKGKRPAMGNWSKLTSYIDVPFNEWRKCRNIALLCGEVSGVIVVDIDNKTPDIDTKNTSLKISKRTGVDEWNDVIAKNGEPNTLKISTPSGGFHYYFQYEERVAKIPSSSCVAMNDSGEIVAWDVKNNGGYVVMPPSVNPENNQAYSVINRCPVGTIPDWLLDYITRRSRNTVSKRQPAKAITNNVHLSGPTKSDCEPLSYEASSELINLLDVSRSDDYETWYRGIFALKTLDLPENNIYQLVHQFSARSPDKYVSENTDKQYGYESDGSITMGTLMDWLKEDIGDIRYVDFKKRHNLFKKFTIKVPLPSINFNDDFSIYDYEKWATNRRFESKDHAEQELLRQLARVARKIPGATPMYVFKEHLSYSFTKRNAGHLAKDYGSCIYMAPNPKSTVEVPLPSIQKTLSIMSPLSNTELLCRDITWQPYHADQPIDTGDLLNLFTGFKAKLVPLTDEKVQRVCQPWVNHIFHIMANGNIENFKWIFTHIAYPIRYLKRSNKLLALLGQQGAGKTLIFDNLLGPKIYGNHLSVTSNGTIDALNAKFNSHLRDKMLYVMGDELSNDKLTSRAALFNKTKEKITGNDLQIEQKGIDIKTYPNFLSLVLCANGDGAIFMDDKERRSGVFEVSNSKVGDKEYFNNLISLCDQDAANIFYSYLRSDYCKDFLVDIEDVPVTEIKEEIIEMSQPKSTSFASDFLSGDKQISSSIIRNHNGRPFIFTKDLYEEYKFWARDNNITVRDKKIFSRDFNKRKLLEYTGSKVKPSIGGDRDTGYYIPESLFDSIEVIVVTYVSNGENPSMPKYHTVSLRTYITDPQLLYK